MANAAAHTSAPVPLTQARLNGADQICVHARLLHQHLQNPTRFLKWFRIKSAALGFVCHRDYEPSFEALEGTPAAENFLLTLQAATVLVAAEDSDRGQELCRYLMLALSQEHNTQVERSNAAPTKVQTITTAQAKMLKQLANERVSQTRLPYQTVWAELKNRFGIRSYLDLRAEEFESACDFLSRPPEFLPTQFNYPGEQEIVLPDVTREVIESYSFDLSIDSIPLLRMILRNYISQCADPESLVDTGHVHELLSQRFRHIEDCLNWANRRG